MSIVRKASRIEFWGGNGAGPVQEHYLTLHGPNGGTQHVELVGDARDTHRLDQDKAELLAALDWLALTVASTVQDYHHDQDEMDAMANAHALLAKHRLPA